MRPTALLVALILSTTVACTTGPVNPTPEPIVAPPTVTTPAPTPPTAPVTPAAIGLTAGPQPINPGDDVQFAIYWYSGASLPEPWSCVWDFGDRSTVTTSDPRASHRYSAGGSYSASVTVTGSDGHTITARAQIGVITPTPPPVVPPVVVPDPAVLQVALACTPALHGLATACNITVTDSAGAIVTGSVSAVWTWGDGEPTTTALLGSHPYAQAGTYTVEVTATGGTKTGRATKVLTIS